MFALPGSLLWLFLLVYLASGQILKITSLDISNKKLGECFLCIPAALREAKGYVGLETSVSLPAKPLEWPRCCPLEEFADVSVENINHTNIQSHEEKKENKTAALVTEEKNEKPNSQDDNKQTDLLINKTLETNSQILSDSPQELNKTLLTDFSERNHRRRKTNQTASTSNTTGIPSMSQERRNSYLSIAERRKYYNRTREQTKKLQFNDVELEYQETTNKPVISSTETVQINEIRVVRKPITKDSREIAAEKNQASNQRLLSNFHNNETHGKPQSIRQSVIQSQYQFGQKINLRKPISRGQDTQEERLKKKKERSKTESIMENNTNKLNKNYPTQSTRLIRVDKNIWATTVTPQMDNENFVTHLKGNDTVLEKPDDYITGNYTQKEIFSNRTAVISELEIKNDTKVPQTNTFNPLPLNNLNITEERTLKENFNTPGLNISSIIHDVYNQEILKLNNTNLETAKEDFGKNVSNYNKTANSSQWHSVTETVLGASNISTTVRTTTLLKFILNGTDKINFITSATPPKARNGKFSSYQATLPTILKSNSNETFGDHHATTPFVKAIFKQSANLTSKPRFTHSQINESTTVKIETKEKRPGAENRSKTEEYPLTIELNENNKRVLSEMFLTSTTPKPKQIAKNETVTSQGKLPDISKNGSSIDNNPIKFSTTTVSPELSSSSAGPTTRSFTTVAGFNATITTTAEAPRVISPDDHQEDQKAQGTQYNTKFYISPKFNGSQVIKVVEEEEDDDDEEVNVRGRSAGVAIYVLAAFGLVPLLLALVFGAKFMIQRNQREYDCESDAKSELSTNESQTKEGKKKKGSTDLKKSPSNVTTITLVTATRLPRVQHWENSEKQGNRNWEFPRSKIKLKTILGQGNFGQVWKAEAEDMPGHEGVTRLVAVKTVKEGATEKEHTEFIKELEIMQQIGSHPNIVTLLGCCTDQEPYYLIMEYVKYGKLLTYLREHRVNENYYSFSNNSDALTSRDLTVFAYCVARGMEYLASRGIIHRDLAARNVLVDQNKLCKIADFGMSRSVRDSENGQVYEERQQKGALPIRWMAPESLVYSVFTCKSDVWSFGIVMWEIVTLGSTPYPNMGAREVMRKVRDGYRLERPSHCNPEFYRLISYCWAHDPNKRPDFSELRHELSNLLDNPTKDGSYVDLDRFAVDNGFHVSTKTNDFRLLERNDFKTLQKLGDWSNKDWPEDMKKTKTKRGRNNGKGTVTLTGQGSFTVNSRILEKEFKII